MLRITAFVLDVIRWALYSFAKIILECDRLIVSRNEGHLTDSRR